jgi:excisionase family DNA binding protein
MTTSQVIRVRPEQYAQRNSVHTNTVLSWIREGVIPYIKVRRAILIDVQKADSALEAFERKAK